VSSGLSGIVTRLWAREGAAPRTLQRLLTVSGKGVFAFVSPTPLWKDLSSGLSSGEQKAYVAVLQRSLKDAGYYDGKINGTFSSATKTAYTQWQGDNGMSKTGVLDTDRFVWMPDGSTLSSWSVSLGSRVAGGIELASISAPTALLATALVSQGDLGELKVGQTAQMAIDGYTDEEFTGVITAISDEPASSSASSMSGSSSSGSTQYTITIRPETLPDVARSGMTGTLEIVLEEHADVLLVPTSAVTGTSSTSYVRVMQNGVPVVRQVETGMTTSSSTEITSGLAEGETVVTGTYTPGASGTTSGTSGSRSSLGNVLNGGTMPAGPPPGMSMPDGSQ
jgi:peptidoglycan hydrolase-like protein with peptidoglycan-binding domain